MSTLVQSANLGWRQGSAVRARLAVADELGLDAVFAELNGAFFIASIRRLHKLYGDALGAVFVAPDGPKTRAQRRLSHLSEAH
ncbi:MAG: hypothetical protein AUK47_00160 [Deltaproteobacteria bacterium CG2_30_63_29]|nr:MAG: hypothetical protein AUK47_00160 [Deltaproteobacteria bacterium CG2_30_63_29]PJB33272.1 MAG: hypothetical protein CO108_31225 [Deltaproteobacteria bacterium CG_4_9_14_3_um_filter_63_12]